MNTTLDMKRVVSRANEFQGLKIHTKSSHSHMSRNGDTSSRTTIRADKYALSNSAKKQT